MHSMMIKQQLLYLADELEQKLLCLKAKILRRVCLPRTAQKLGNCALFLLLFGFGQLGHSPLVRAEGLPEYRLKAAFLYNFAIYTQWPDVIYDSFNLCIYGEHSFGNELSQLQKKQVNQRNITIKFTDQVEDLSVCQMVFISRPSTSDMKNILGSLQDKPILTITDNPGDQQYDAMLNMIVINGKIKFDVNLVVTRNSGLNFSSQLLRFAREVYK